MYHARVYRHACNYACMYVKVRGEPQLSFIMNCLPSLVRQGISLGCGWPIQLSSGNLCLPLPSTVIARACQCTQSRCLGSEDLIQFPVPVWPALYRSSYLPCP